MIKKIFSICENKGCFHKLTKNSTYLSKTNKDGKTLNVRVCEKCFRKLIK